MAGSGRHEATVSPRDGMSAMDSLPVTETWYNLRKLKKRNCMWSDRKTCGFLQLAEDTMKNTVSRFPAGRGCFGDGIFAQTHGCARHQTVARAILHEKGILAHQKF
jgi:hypothetical protein